MRDSPVLTAYALDKPASEETMTYDYESLLEQHFQMLIQALLVKSYPDLQCYPVGMPDGGRDGSAKNPLAPGSIIFQVKFARDPNAIVDKHKWLVKAINGELEKIRKLAARGASSYVLITNIKGTSHLDTGRYDKLQKHLDAVLPIHGIPWLRDELDRHLDGEFDLKMHYPALLKGSDLLRMVWERAGVGNRIDALTSALRAYLAAQYEQDRSIRFKQAELPSSALFELFVDVPVTWVASGSRGRQIDSRGAFVSAAIARRRRRDNADSENDRSLGEVNNITGEEAAVAARYDDYFEAEELSIGGADLLLNGAFTEKVRCLVLEGAPGQGKSTLTQYLAQVHRARFLSASEAGNILEMHRIAPLVIPIRLELRDIAIWMNGVDPWAKKPGTTHDKDPILESAIARQIERNSGVSSITVEDLHTLSRIMPIHLLLDGLDEVADLAERRKVVEEIIAATVRLEAVAQQLNVLVTSRPTAIIGSPTFPKDRFTLLRLSPINRELALDYCQKWAIARDLDEKDRAEVSAVLAQKMDAPHMADLARNTMQLSILLSLIYLRGASLPDKRTELYDKYVETFFNREVEKNEIVRKNRTLLIDIHRYVAFYVHATAERGKTNGRISVAELRRVLTAYLAKEGRPAALIDELMMGTVERVVALVSRVEGTYEFEVQPLREYFSARFMYDTAPYSPPGQQMRGTLPDRFDAVAHNPYWSNVTRFFAGCFSKGELLDLAERLCLLIADKEFRYSLYPRSLALSLLQDWVFTQSVSATERVVDAIFDQTGIRMMNARHAGRMSLDGLSGRLTADTGGNRLWTTLFEKLKREKVKTERSDSICWLISTHAPKSELRALWISEALKRRPARRSRWVEFGSRLGIFLRLNADELNQVLEMDDKAIRANILATLASNGANVELLGEQDRVLAIARMFDNRLLSSTRNTSAHSLNSTFNPALWTSNRRAEWLPAEHVSSSGERTRRVDPITNSSLPGARRALEFSQMLEATSGIPDLVEWRLAEGFLIENFGDTFRNRELSIVSGCVTDPNERGAGAGDLFDSTYSLVDRVRNAKRRARQAEWWRKQAEAAQLDIDRLTFALALYVWASPEVVVDLVGELDDIVKSLAGNAVVALIGAASHSRAYSDRARRYLPFSDVAAIARLAPTTIALVSNRISLEVDASSLLPRLFQQISREGVATPGIALAAREVAHGRIPGDEFLRYCIKGHEAGGSRAMRGSRDLTRRVRELPFVSSEQIWQAPDSIVEILQVQNDHDRPTKPVLDTAESENWISLARR
jgi:hypothetical protein